MRKIENFLVVGVAVDRGHRSLLHAELVVQHFHHRRQTICGARRVRNNIVLRSIVEVIVHSQYDGDVLVLGGGGNNHLLDGTAQMFAGILGIGEMAR